MKIVSNSVKETLKIGRAIAKKLREGDILCLFGDLGSGKTVFTKGLALGLKIKSDRIISPSFVLIREHLGAMPLFHFDLYRLRNPLDIATLGYEEYLYDQGITVIEWAERLGCLLPREYLKVNLSIKKDTVRLMEISAFGRHYETLLDKIRENFRN